jgi:uncharacterized Zn finger protein
MVTVIVSEQSVRAAADARSFERGRAYFRDGRVQLVQADRAGVAAVVDGGNAYRVRLTATPEGLAGQCTCPYGAEGMFCKHCVAAALAWLDNGTKVAHQQPTPDVLRRFLLAQDVDWLVDELLHAAASDPALQARLDLAAGTDTRDGSDEQAMRARLQRAIEIDDFVRYRDAYSYFHGVGEALDDVAKLIDQGHADTAMRLAEFALELLDEAGQSVDDSAGGLGEALEHVQEVHFDACSATSPDPVQLAEYLVGRALASNYEVFLGAVTYYEPLLGEAGMAKYRELVEAAWRDLPPKQPHQYGTGRFTVTHLMEQLAEHEGGTDALIKVLARDLSSGHDVLRIAQRLCHDGRDDEALDWLARGLNDFPPDSRLRSLAAECHLRAGRRKEAIDMHWANFTDRPNLDTYIALHNTAADTFPTWRNRALAVLTKTAKRDHSTAVEVLLWEGETEAAWHAAVKGGCYPQLWLRLARERATTHPSDAIPVLLRAADQQIENKNRNSYQVAAKLLTEAKTLFTRCARDTEFEDHLRVLRAAHKPKRALREELDRARLP